MSYFRNFIGMSQNLFAAWIGVESSLLAKWETNKRSLSNFPKANNKSFELEIQWQTFSQNWTPDLSSVLELPADEIKKRKKWVDSLLWDEDILAKKACSLERTGSQYPYGPFLPEIGSTD